MKNLCKIYYGISGTFKGTTIEHDRGDCNLVLWSSIKTWKSIEQGIFSGMCKRNDLNYAILHLCNIEQLLKNHSGENFYIERGITDMDFYHIKNSGEKEGEWIEESVKKELEYLRDFSIQKILLVQKDYDFIRDIILSEPTRAKEFNGPDDYLRQQENYIQFTKKYNQIDEEITITSAEDYLSGLGLKITNKNN